MLLTPPPHGTCPACAVAHGDAEAHDATSLYYQMRFFGLRGRWPTWADAIAHCSPQAQALWKRYLDEFGAWTEPADGRPIADPPAETVRQAIGDPNARGFGPGFDPSVPESEVS